MRVQANQHGTRTFIQENQKMKTNPKKWITIRCQDPKSLVVMLDFLFQNLTKMKWFNKTGQESNNRLEINKCDERVVDLLCCTKKQKMGDER